jgi:hypothetical protein
MTRLSLVRQRVLAGRLQTPDPIPLQHPADLNIPIKMRTVIAPCRYRVLGPADRFENREGVAVLPPLAVEVGLALDRASVFQHDAGVRSLNREQVHDLDRSAAQSHRDLYAALEGVIQLVRVGRRWIEH